MKEMDPKTRTITFRISEENGLVTIDVRDAGIGISEEALPSIFRHGFTTKADGHGFGLHLSALSAQEMGGSLRVESDGEGFGTTFTLSIPTAPKHAVS